jgi:tRNA dimethylallyltransferase
LQDVFFNVGPTPTGKSEMGAEVAARCKAEVVGADEFQMYHGLPRLTAQPDEALLRKVRHHLIATISLRETMSAERFRMLAVSAIEQINRRGKLAIVVGGSGLYLKALTHGLAPLPPIDPKLRAELNALTLEQLNSRLLVADPSGAEKIDRQNKRRVVRALEIFAQTRRPASEQRAQWAAQAVPARGVFVFRDRAELYARIESRIEQMFRQGVADEVAQVNQISATAVKTIGFREIRQLLEGKIDRQECIAAIQQMTRRYAKRQLTWFRQQTNFEPLNLSLLKDHSAAVELILQKVALLRPLND